MEALEENAHNIVKGKRTKRLRPHSPLRTISSTAEGGDSSGAAAADSDHVHTIVNSNSASSPANSFDLLQQESSEEDEDLANCLILLAKGQSREDPKVEDGGGAIVAAAKAAFYAYECKTCNRTFPSFQALGGHRASHKKPRAEEKKILGFLEMEEAQLKPPLTLQLSSRAFNIAGGGGGKSRVHECSICGAEFTSGQALGGHMRRHRAPVPVPVPVPIAATTALSLTPLSAGCFEPRQAKRPKTVLSLDLDLNLPAPEDDHKFSLGSKQQKQQQQQQQQQQQASPPLMFPAPTLVDCHY